MLKNKPTGLAHVAVPTDDPAGTVAFYETLGFTRLVDHDIRGMLQCGSCVVEYYPRRGDQKPVGNIDHIALASDDLDAAFEEVSAMGVQFVTNGIESNQMFEPRSNRYFTFIGPNGEKIEFCQVK